MSLLIVHKLPLLIRYVIEWALILTRCLAQKLALVPKKMSILLLQKSPIIGWFMIKMY